MLYIVGMGKTFQAHIDALRLRLSNERARLAAAKTQGERDMRAVWVAQIERELAAEPKLDDIDDDELMRQLGA